MRRLCTGRSTVTSARQTFMQLKPDVQILDHLDNLGLGYVAKNRSRKAILTKYEKEIPGVKAALRKRRSVLVNTALKQAGVSPYPFNKGARKVQSIVVAKRWSEVPDFGDIPEVAVIGRSNVGKSTLINAILGYTPSHIQKASVSEKPGETTALQFFTLGRNITTKKPTFVVTDMPGYGFAYMKDSEAKRCFYLCSEYLRSRERRKLKRVLLLIDARHGFKRTDFTCIRNLISMTYTGPDVENTDQQDETSDFSPDTQIEETDVGLTIESSNSNKDPLKKVSWKLQVVLTKCDLVERSVLARRVQIMRSEISEKFSFLKLSNMPILMVSAVENKGIVELHKELAALVPPMSSGILERQ